MSQHYLFFSLKSSPSSPRLRFLSPLVRSPAGYSSRRSDASISLPVTTVRRTFILPPPHSLTAFPSFPGFGVVRKNERRPVSGGVTPFFSPRNGRPLTKTRSPFSSSTRPAIRARVTEGRSRMLSGGIQVLRVRHVLLLDLFVTQQCSRSSPQKLLQILGCFRTDRFPFFSCFSFFRCLHLFRTTDGGTILVSPDPVDWHHHPSGIFFLPAPSLPL